MAGETRQGGRGNAILHPSASGAAGFRMTTKGKTAGGTPALLKAAESNFLIDTRCE
jgi:hypothetical protein